MEAAHGLRLNGLQHRMRPVLRKVPRRAFQLLPGRVKTIALDVRDSGRLCTGGRRRHDVDNLVSIETYWLSINGMQGPAVSVFAGREETMRIDCLVGDPHLHYHITSARGRWASSDRVRLPPGDHSTQITRVQFELANNLPYSLQLDRRSGVRRHHLTDEQLLAAIGLAIGHLRELVSRPPDLPMLPRFREVTPTRPDNSF